MSLQFNSASLLLKGTRQTEKNTFSIHELLDKQSSVLAVCAGANSPERAGEAIEICMQAFSQYILAHYPANSTVKLLQDAALAANNALKAALTRTPEFAELGISLIGAIAENKKVTWVSIGGNHLYIIRGDVLLLHYTQSQQPKAAAQNGNDGESQMDEGRRLLWHSIIEDNTYHQLNVTEVADKLPKPQESAATQVTNVLSGQDITIDDISYKQFTLEVGDRILMFSHKLRALSTNMIIQYSAFSRTPESCANSIKRAIDAKDRVKYPIHRTVVIVDAKKGKGSVVTVVNKNKVDWATGSEPAAAKNNATITKKPQVVVSQAPAEPTAVAKTKLKAEPKAEPATESVTEPATSTSSNKRLYIIVATAIAITLNVLFFLYYKGVLNKPAVADDPVVIKKSTTVAVTDNEATSDEAPIANAQDQVLLANTQDEAATASTQAEAATASAQAEAATASTQAEAATASTQAEAATASAQAEAPKAAPQAKTAVAAKVPGESFQEKLAAGGTGPLMIWVPKGDFTMGNRRHANTSPKRNVAIETFAVSVKEVTVAEYTRYARAVGLRKIPATALGNEDFPMTNVSWHDANAYTKWLSEQTGQTYRLLSEAEWEYIASTGKSSPFWWGHDMQPDKAHCYLGCIAMLTKNDMPIKTPVAVGSFAANAFGIYDTSGNVAEWVQDCWHRNYMGAPTDGSVFDGGDCRLRVVRGGSFTSPEQAVTNFARDKHPPNKTYDFIGIRVARE